MASEITIRHKSAYGGMTFTKFQLSRWTKHGKDRLYVNDQYGKAIAYVDLVTKTFVWVKKTLATEIAEKLQAEAIQCAKEILTVESIAEDADNI